MSIPVPILYDLYLELRKEKWLQPGLDEYYLFFELIGSGYKIENFEQLSFALETIWMKSPAQQYAFRQLLNARRTLLQQVLNQLAQNANGNKTSDPNSTLPGIETEKINRTDGVDGENSNAIATDPVPTILGERKIELENISPQEEEISPAYFSINAGNADAGNNGFFNIAGTADEKKSLIETPYVLTSDYFPVNNRHLQQAWRTLKNKAPGEESNELDVKMTIREITQEGYFSKLSFNRHIRNHINLFIFIDRSDSMTAVEDFGKELCRTAMQSELYHNVKPLYFSRVPLWANGSQDYVLTTENSSVSKGIKKMLAPFNKRNTVVLIYSDAGALQSDDDEDRLLRTTNFISFLKQYTAYISWLNPAPQHRWQDSIAIVLSEDVPMFTTERTGVESAIDALKGKWAIKNKSHASAKSR